METELSKLPATFSSWPTVYTGLTVGFVDLIQDLYAGFYAASS